MSTPQNDMDADESSGVTTLRPVPAKPARLLDLSEGDSTHYFSATELLERGKALAAHPSELAAKSAPQSASTPEVAAPDPGARGQVRQASVARRAIAILLPLLSVLLLAKPVLKPAEQPAATKATASAATPVAPPEPMPVTPPPIAAAAPLALPRGVTVAHAAADSVATGDFSRAATLYRELARREPNQRVYSEAARILSERAQVQTR